jgi:radical SAM/Cys-rich protein
MASLPHYSPEMTERVRGRDVYRRSIAGLQALNAVGYGQPAGPLELTLVYNPASAVLPAAQRGLEDDFRHHLSAAYGITFTRLIAMANVPTGRFLCFLVNSGNLARYMARLEGQFNPSTLPNLMCRSLISVAWDGTLYDCDFNQGLGLAIRNGKVATIRQVSLQQLVGRAIACRNHCYCCTAGQGSSCGGAVA